MNKLLILLFLPLMSFGQVDSTASEVEFNRDPPQTISLVNFNKRVDRANVLLDSLTPIRISDVEHINIMMCLNTISKGDYKGGRYDSLMAKSKVYTVNIIKVYKIWIPNKGMGYFFPRLKMELFGTPSLYAIFNVKE